MDIDEAQAIVARADYHIDINGDMDSEFIDAIDTVFQALERTRWIPVSERLPEFETVVALANFNGVRGFVIGNAEKLNINQATVTHWMPLPELPEVE